MRTIGILAPYLALSCLGVGSLQITEPQFYEVPSVAGTAKRTGIAANRRAARKAKNRRRSR